MFLKLDPQEYEEVKTLLNAYPERAKQAIVFAINRSVKGLRADVTRSITSKYSVKKQDLLKKIRLKTANKNNLKGHVNIFANSIPLDKFPHSPSSLGSKRPKIGVKVSLLKGQSEFFAGSFLGISKDSKKTFIFKRNGEFVDTKKVRKKNTKRGIKGSAIMKEKLERLKSPVVSSMLTDGEVDKVYLSAKERFMKNLEHMMTKGFAYQKSKGGAK